MARATGRLTALKVTRTKKPGIYGDGGGLYLQVAASGAKSWVLRFMLNRRARTMGLGPTHALGLAEARHEATEARKLLAAGVDPIEARKGKRAAQLVEAAKSVTFRQATDEYIEGHSEEWRNAKHAAQWRSTLATYAYPILGGLPVSAIDTALVLKVLKPIWSSKTETASRVRGRIEAVLDAQTALGRRTGDNPARWRGNLKKLLGERSKVRKVRHHPALPYSEVGGFMADLRDENALSARALEFLILTACRTSEVVGARWQEVDLTEKVWTIPANRIKAGREHKVPLSAPAVALLRRLEKAKHGEFVFPGGRTGKPLSNMALLALIKRMGHADLTVHGFRSTFRDWTAEQTNYPHHVAEMALAHSIGDKVEAAYRRGDLLEKRRRLMQAWADFCARPKAAGKVLPMRRKGA